MARAPEFARFPFVPRSLLILALGLCLPSSGCSWLRGDGAEPAANEEEEEPSAQEVVAPRKNARPPEEDKASDSIEKDDVAEGFKRAQKRLEEGSPADALQELDEAARAMREDDPRMISYHVRKGGISLHEGDLSAAKAAYKAAIQLAQRLKIMGGVRADAYAGMGICLMRENNHAAAKKFFERGLDSEPSANTRRIIEERLDSLGKQ